MSKAPAVPRILLEMALRYIGDPLSGLIESGADLDDHVWAYFDGRVPPGRNVAVKHLLSQGASLEQATAKVHAAIKEARDDGGVFAFGVMTTRRGLLALLEEMGMRGVGGGELRRWLDSPTAAANHFRVVIIAGSQIQMQYAERN